MPLIFVLLNLLLSIIGLFTQQWLAFAFFGLCALVLIFTEWYQPKNRYANEKVEFDSVELRRIMRTGKVERMHWNDLDTIRIISTEEGPFNDDIFWLFTDSAGKNGCAVPNYADGFAELLQHIQTFPNFDNEKVVQAMGSTEEAVWIIWERVKQE